MTRIALALATSLLVSSALTGALAGTPVQVGRFDQIELRGGGHVTVKHGATQSVTLIKGDANVTKFRVKDGGKLVIDVCDHDCPMGRYELDVEIVTPDLTGAAIDGGGHIVAETGFPARDSFAAAIDGGGDIDAAAIAAATVTAAIDGGGKIHVSATKHLQAAIDGGGHISYRGDPQVSEAIDGGGSVEKEK
jgi:hypothetical protein